jgi:hypothetical protein
VIQRLREYAIIGIALGIVTSVAFGEDSNITNTTTTTSTVTSNNTNVNTNNNNNVNTTTSNNTNTNLNTNNTTINSTATNTNNNTNVSTSTSNVTSNITQTQNVTNTNTSTVNSTSNNTNLSTNSNTNINTSTSSSTVNTQNTNNNTNVNSSQNVNTNNSTSTSSATQKVTQRIKTAPPSAVAPSIMSYSQDLCTTGASAAVQTQIFGVSAGKSVRDENCERLKNSKALYDMGMKVAAVALLCQDYKVYRAMEQSGSPCPYKGKIGAEAQKAWDENPEDRPDWHLIKADMKGYEFRAYKKKDFCKKYPTQKICLKP